MARRSFSKKDRARIFAAIAYDPQSGLLTWKEKQPFVHAGIGEEIGGLANGYRRVKIDGRSVLCHRIAWLLHYGEEPSDTIDHINGHRSDNRIENLRVVTHAENSKNRSDYRGKTLPKGVTFHPASGKFRARIRCDRKLHSLGLYDSKEEASAAYRGAAQRLFGPLARAV